MYLIPKAVYFNLMKRNDIPPDVNIRQLNNLDVNEGGKVTLRNDNITRKHRYRRDVPPITPDDNDDDNNNGNGNGLENDNGGGGGGGGDESNNDGQGDIYDDNAFNLDDQVSDGGINSNDVTTESVDDDGIELDNAQTVVADVHNSNQQADAATQHDLQQADEEIQAGVPMLQRANVKSQIGSSYLQRANTGSQAGSSYLERANAGSQAGSSYLQRTHASSQAGPSFLQRANASVQVAPNSANVESQTFRRPQQQQQPKIRSPQKLKQSQIRRPAAVASSISNRERSIPNRERSPIERNRSQPIIKLKLPTTPAAPINPTDDIQIPLVKKKPVLRRNVKWLKIGQRPKKSKMKKASNTPISQPASALPDDDVNMRQRPKYAQDIDMKAAAAAVKKKAVKRLSKPPIRQKTVPPKRAHKESSFKASSPSTSKPVPAAATRTSIKAAAATSNEKQKLRVKYAEGEEAIINKQKRKSSKPKYKPTPPPPPTVVRYKGKSQPRLKKTWLSMKQKEKLIPTGSKRQHAAEDENTLGRGLEPEVKRYVVAKRKQKQE
jgi:hypothetical protein